MFLKEIETKEIKGIIEQIKPNKSCGTDEIHPKVIKQTAPYISKPYISKILHHIFNLTFQTGTIPSALKISLITPVFKSANNTIFTNYRARPISFLPCFSRILEKVMYKALVEYMELKKKMLHNMNISMDSEMIGQLTWPFFN